MLHHYGELSYMMPCVISQLCSIIHEVNVTEIPLWIKQSTLYNTKYNHRSEVYKNKSEHSVMVESEEIWEFRALISPPAIKQNKNIKGLTARVQRPWPYKFNTYLMLQSWACWKRFVPSQGSTPAESSSEISGHPFGYREPPTTTS